ncbi:C39 family peptidase [Tychonema sp. LEGE 07199]|uniref:glycosyl hydrolase 108 family protein n=1 Tax=unclassified Tychonema TaxID=2642144 RepID=UPI00187E0118|nr:MULTISPECIES: glycosyl hydrolase 108 family protein [unclassified Tychonema]MBE9119853.1 C39 family peptidase [Tychonema sp. LEGE 07199]MBE9132406.1 C39 family peptidase [Tychonema sp. LEGE 07196]
MAINHNVPYFSQEDNEIEPLRTCGATSAAMCLKYFNVPDLGSFPQYEDDVKARFDRLGIDHGSPDGIKRLLEGLGLKDNLTLTASLSDITRSLDSGEICILHGFWTGSGHILVIRGYNNNGDFFVNDPHGEWVYGGYHVNSTVSPDNKGENKLYSRRLISSGANAFNWPDALDFYRNWDSNKIESTATMWLHRVSIPQRRGPNPDDIPEVKEDLSKLGEILKNKRVIKLEKLTADKELVREIQRRLNALGLLELSDVDGIFGNVTKKALTRFCDSVFLNNMNTGLFGPTFFQKLMDRRGTPGVTSFSTGAPGSLPNKLAFALQFTLMWEGGYVDNPFDLGGPTNKGITHRNYDTYRIAKGLPTKDVQFIEDAEVMEIYFEMYWKPSQADSMILPLAIVHFDTAVLFGVSGAVQFLQEALGVGVDGIFGPQTESGMRANNNKETALNIIDGRIAYHRRRVEENISQDVFLQGWVNRANDLRKFITEL